MSGASHVSSNWITKDKALVRSFDPVALGKDSWLLFGLKQNSLIYLVISTWVTQGTEILSL